MSSRCVVGVDVAKDTLEVAVSAEGKTFTVRNQSKGIRSLISKLEELGVDLVIMEATGGYERPLRDALAKAGLPARVVNPANVRHFARSGGTRAKTDPIDARVLVRYAEAHNIQPELAPTEEEQELKDLDRRRRQLVKELRREKNRLGHTLAEPVRESIKRHTSYLEAEIAALERILEEHVHQVKELRERKQLLETAPAVGPKTSTSCTVLLPELGTLGPKQIAGLVGLAPHPKDSGKKSSPRTISGGRPEVRSALYMAALAATTHNPVLKEFYQRLIQRGKPPKVALCAVARKLLVIMNAMVRDNKPWDPALAGA